MAHSRTFHCAALSAVLLLALPARAGEKVQIKSSTTVELPKPKHSLEDLRSLRTPEAPSGRDEYEGGIAAGTPVHTYNPKMDKKLKEMLDKKRNWIFVNPYEMQFDSKTEEFMKGEKGTGLFDHPLMQDEEKTVLEKFIDEKNPDRENDPDSNEINPGQAARKEMLGLGGEGEGKFNDGETGLTLGKTESLQFNLNQKATFVSERGLFQQKLERTPFSERGLMSRFSEEAPSISKEDLRKESDARKIEFNNLFQSPAIASPVTSGFDPLNSAPDATRLEVSPIGARRSEQFLNVGRAESGNPGFAPARNSPLFSGSGFSTAVPGRNSSSSRDIFGSSTIGQPSAVAPSASFTPPAPSRSAISQKPFVLPFPKRKF